jgi:hypothetical protein
MARPTLSTESGATPPAPLAPLLLVLPLLLTLQNEAEPPEYGTENTLIFLFYHLFYCLTSSALSAGLSQILY